MKRSIVGYYLRRIVPSRFKKRFVYSLVLLLALYESWRTTPLLGLALVGLALVARVVDIVATDWIDSRRHHGLEAYYTN